MFFTACSVEQTVKNFPRSENIHLNETIILEPINVSGSMFTTDDYLVIYQLKIDSMLFRYYSLDDLQFVLGGGRRGRGPDEFVTPPNVRSFIVEGNGFNCISTPFTYMVHIEDNDLRIVRHESELDITLRSFGSNNFAKVAEDVYCVSNANLGKNYEFVLFDKKGENARWVSPYPNWANVNLSEGQGFLTYVSTVVANPELKRFIVFYAYFRRVRMFDSEGKMIKDISVEFPFKFPQYEPKSRVLAYSQIPYYDDKYIYLISLNGESSKKGESTELQIWNWNAEPVAILNLDKRLNQFTISQEKKRLYAINPNNDIINNKIFWCDLPAWLYNK